MTLFQAKVTEVIDEEAGIYLLNNCMKLYITFLKDLTGEVWNEESLYKAETFVETLDNHQSYETLRTSHLSKNMDVYQCLTVGDTIRIIRCHYILKEKKVTLVCCGRSYIINER